MATPTGKELAEQLKILKEVNEVLKKNNDLTEKLDATQKSQLLVAQASLDNIDQRQKSADSELKTAQARLQIMRESDTADQSAIERQQKKIGLLKESSKYLTDNAVQIKKETAAAKNNYEEVKKARLDGYNQANDLNKKLSADNAKRHVEATATIKGAAATVGATISTMGEALGNVLRSPELAAMALFPGLGKGLRQVESDISKMPAQLDQSIAGMVKNSALPVKELGDNLVYALDPAYAERMGVSLKGVPPLLRNVGISAKEGAEATMALTNNVALFRPAFMKAQPAAAAFLTNTVAGLGKLGVKSGTTSKILNNLTKAMKMTPIEAGKSLKSISTVANSLGLNMGKVMDSFSQMSPTLAQFGGEMVDVFADLQAQAQGTGVEVNKLLGVAMKMDTFEGAAKHAQTLNAVLGQSAISVTDLVHADPADKIAMIQDAIANAGIDFETADRRMKQVIATAAGFESVEEASKVLLNKEAAEEASDAVDTATMSQTEFSKKIQESMTVSEKMTASLQSMTGGMSKILKTVQPGAVKFSNTMAKGFVKIRDASGDSMAAVIGMQGGIKTINASAKLGKEILGDFAEAAGVAVTGGGTLVKTMAGLVGVGGVLLTGKGFIEGVTADAPSATAKPPEPANDLTILSDGRTFTANEQDNLFLRKDMTPPDGIYKDAEIFSSRKSCVWRRKRLL